MMMAKIDGNGLAYWHDIPETILVEDGVKETTRSVYRMWCMDRVAFLVSVINDDPELIIYVGLPDAEKTNAWLATDDRASRGLHEVGGTPESPGELKDHVDGMTLQRVVYLGYPVLLTLLYVPEHQDKSITD
jgi:hypothetical protein